MLKWISQLVYGLGLALLFTCTQAYADSQGISLAVSSNAGHNGSFVANPGASVSVTYQFTLNNAYDLDFSKQSYAINISPLHAPFSITQNTCAQVSLGNPCSVTVQYAPQSSSDSFVSQNLVIGIGNQSVTLPLQGIPANIKVPITPLAPDNLRTGINLNVAGGPNVTTMFDTGSSALVVEQAYVGSHVQMTTQQVTVDYANYSIQGVLAYGSVEIGGDTALTTSNNTPIVVVPNNALYPFSDAHAIMGVNLETAISARLYLPAPYNQMMLIDRADGGVFFGVFDKSILSGYAQLQLQDINCSNLGIPEVFDMACWNDREVPLNLSITGSSGLPLSITVPTSFDSGSESSAFFADRPPSWAIMSGNMLENQISATLNISGSSFAIPLRDTHLSTSPYISNTTLHFNSGPDVFDHYNFLYDQADGIIGVKPNG